MACRDHNTAIKGVNLRDIRYRGSGCYVKKTRVSARCGNSRRKRILKHIRRASCILTDNDLRSVITLVILAVIPADEATDLICVLYGKYNVSFTAEAVGSKIFSHVLITFQIYRLLSFCYFGLRFIDRACGDYSSYTAERIY